jgi:hypothetical protein
MKKFLNNIKAEAGNIRLTHAEKAAMQAAIFGLPVGKAGAASPMYVEPSPYFFFSYQFRMALAGVLMLVVVGTGTASAAQGSVPGDLLYTVKISITEPVELALAPSASAKADVQVRLAERRIEEAQSLAAEGRLEAGVAEQLATSFDAHAESAQQLADSVEESDPGTATEVKTKLAASFSVQGAVLFKLGKDSNNSGSKEQSDVLATRVIARAEGPARVTAQTKLFAAMAPAPTTDPTSNESGAVQTMSLSVAEDTYARTEVAVEDAGSQKRAAYLQKKASESLANSKKLAATMQKLLDATTTAQVEKAFSAADVHMSAGASLAGESSYSQATEEFTEVLRISGRLEALLKAEKKFDNGILRELLGGEVQGEAIETIEPAIEVVAPVPATAPPAVEADLDR